jgi:hypothetical protein
VEGSGREGRWRSKAVLEEESADLPVSSSAAAALALDPGSTSRSVDGPSAAASAFLSSRFGALEIAPSDAFGCIVYAPVSQNRLPSLPP